MSDGFRTVRSLLPALFINKEVLQYGRHNQKDVKASEEVAMGIPDTTGIPNTTFIQFYFQMDSDSDN